MGGSVMEISKVTSKGQITIPIEIRKKLNLKTGDKVVFIEEGDKIIFANSSMIALREFQEAMKGCLVSFYLNGKLRFAPIEKGVILRVANKPV